MNEMEEKLTAQVLESLGGAESINIDSIASAIVGALHPCHCGRLVRLAESILRQLAEVRPDPRNSVAVRKALALIQVAK